MQTILLAEDEPILGKLVMEALEKKGYQVHWAKDGQEAFDSFRQQQPNICILDVMMPTINGFVLAGKIRNISDTVPILFLTARSETADVIKGFEVGGNDYLKKPFSIEELFLRIRELLKRSTQQSPLLTQELPKEKSNIGQYEFDPVTQVLQWDSESIVLSHKETQLLQALLVHRNDLMPRREALMKIWGDDSFFNARTMDVYITKLRKYLRHDESVSIVNIRGLGFKLIAG